MEVSNFCARSSFSYKGIVSQIRDFSSFPRPCTKSSWILHRLLSPSVKQQNSCLGRSLGRGNGLVVLRNNIPTPIKKAPPSYSFKPCQVKSEDSEGTFIGESLTLDEQTLEQELQVAIKEENYARAAKIRDSLKVLQEDGKASVLAANSRFYHSFSKGDLAAMQALWARGENVCVVHPGVSGISGYDLVMGSWEFVWADYEFPLDIEIKDVQIHVRGDLGYVTCTELVKTKGRNWGRQFATNVFERVNGQWFICIHHASHVDF